MLKAREILVVSFTVLAAACGGAPDGGGNTGSGSSSRTGSSSGTGSSSSDDKEPSDSTDDRTGPSQPAQSTKPSEPTKKAFGAQCSSSADCESDFCVFLSGGGSLGMCTTTCEGDLDCPGFDNRCVRLSDAPQKICAPK